VTVTRRRRRSVETTAEAIEREAIELFYRQGFQATSLRQIANRVGIQVGSLYNHISSKGDLLFEIMESVMLDLLSEQREVPQEGDPVQRLRALVHHHVCFHGEHAKAVFIGNSELRSLTRQQRSRIIVLRNQYEEPFVRALEQGIGKGSFLDVDVKVVVYGIIAMGTSVSAWGSASESALVLGQLWIPRMHRCHKHSGLWQVEHCRAGQWTGIVPTESRRSQGSLIEARWSGSARRCSPAGRA